MKASSMRRTGVRTLSKGCFSPALQNNSPQKVLCEVCSLRKRSMPCGKSTSETVSRTTMPSG